MENASIVCFSEITWRPIIISIIFVLLCLGEEKSFIGLSQK